jgi:DNA-binding PadR family transcriptional regulator
MLDKKLLLLGLIRRHDMHGYQMIEFLDNALAMCVDIKKPTAYYTLNKMCDEGLLSFAEEQAGNRPTRRVYSITPEGEAAFQKALRENLSQHHQTQFDGDVGLAYLDALPTEEARPLLEERRTALQARLSDMEEVPVHTGSLQHMINHQIRHLQAELAWLDEVLTQLK